MKPLKKTNNIKAPKGKIQILIFLGITAIIAFLLSMGGVAETVSNATGWEAMSIQRVASDLFRVLLTLMLLVIAVLVFPFIGILGAVIGLVALCISVPVVYRYFGNENKVE